MLEDKLNPVLTQLKAGESESKANFEIVRTWFQGHEENIAESLADLAFICELPDSERRLLTYPVMGNWYLGKMAGFVPQTEHQEKVFSLLKDLIREHRFSNSHMKSLYGQNEEFSKRWDELNSQMLADVSGSLPLREMMKTIHKEVVRAVYDGKLPHKDTYTMDLGHGLASPSNSFQFLTWYFESIAEKGQTLPLDLTIMVVDDEHPEAWYQRMISAGFRDKEGQQGFFFDCESALKALERGHYDVILTDLELGKGKMGGIKFVEKAYDIQKARGIKPRISVFSYNDKKLQEAEDRLRGYSGNHKVFHQVNHNNKAEFRAIQFRIEVYNTLR